MALTTRCLYMIGLQLALAFGCSVCFSTAVSSTEHTLATTEQRDAATEDVMTSTSPSTPTEELSTPPFQSVRDENASSYVTVEDDDDADADVHPYSVAGRYIYKYGMTGLFVLGSVGNTLALVVLFRGKQLRQHSSSLYLMTLGFIDQYNIFAAVLGSHVIRSYWHFDYIRHNRWLCKVAYFTIVTCAQSSFYLVASMSLERALVVMYPLKFMRTFTRMRTKIVIASIVAFWSLKNCHMFWSNGAVYDKEVNGTKVLRSECGLTRNSRQLYDFNMDVRPWLDYAITFTAAGVIILSNAAIIYGIKRSEKEMPANNQHQQKSKTRAMVPLLVSTSLAFLVFALPLQIITLIWPQNPNDVSSASAALANMLWSIGLLTNYANNGINFYIYCLSGSTFRGELKKVFCHEEKNGSSTSVLTSQTNTSSKF